MASDRDTVLAVTRQPGMALMTKTVIIAVNDPHILYLLQRYAEESGLRTVKTGQNQEVVTLARQIQPTLIVLEVGSPRTAGQAVLRQLRANTSTRSIPVVAYLASPEIAGEPLVEFSACWYESLMYDDFIAALKQVEAASPAEQVDGGGEQMVALPSGAQWKEDKEGRIETLRNSVQSG